MLLTLFAVKILPCVLIRDFLRFIISALCVSEKQLVLQWWFDLFHWFLIIDVGRDVTVRRFVKSFCKTVHDE